jgi:hypothetical protein
MSKAEIEKFKKWESKFLEYMPEPPGYWREQSEIRDRWGKTKYPLIWPSRL